MNKLSQWALISISAVFFFFLFLFIYFPFDDLINYYLGEFEKQGQYKITYSKIEPSFFFKTSIKNFELYSIKGEESLILEAKELKLGISYLALINSQIKGSFEMKGIKGEIEGDLAINNEQFEIDAEIKKYALAELAYLRESLGFPIQGTVSGDIEVSYNLKQIRNSKGSVDLKFNKLYLPEGKVKPVEGFELDIPETHLAFASDAAVKAKLSKGKIEFDSFIFPGEDLIVSLDGSIQLNKRIRLSRMALNGKFKLSPKLEKQLELVLMIIKNQITEEGDFPITLSGRFSKPKIKIGTFEVL